ncbi:hypothetical protein AAIB41_03775 [Brucella sp. BE17]|uniref:hypothetical protein n=1 Tax=Brucella sp. BE17 TaxID=3142977 RepID=UPI0031BA6A45
MKHHHENDPETLIYITKMLTELGKLAKRTDNPLLAYMIEMASQEARDRLEEEQKH